MWIAKPKLAALAAQLGMSRQVRHHFFIGGPDHGFVGLKSTGAEAPFLLDRR